MISYRGRIGISEWVDIVTAGQTSQRRIREKTEGGRCVSSFAKVNFSLRV